MTSIVQKTYKSKAKAGQTYSTSTLILDQSGSVVYKQCPGPNVMVPIRKPVLKPERELHIHDVILKQVSEGNLPWWYEEAPQAAAEQKRERRKLSKV